MKMMAKRSGLLRMFLAITVHTFAGCAGNGVQPLPGKAAVLPATAGPIISCTAEGLSPTEKVRYCEGGGSDFGETRLSRGHQTGHTPEGMVWIPGGEFSMGGVNPMGLQEGGHEPMGDARPVHRVSVGGFYMDATEVTNRQFATFVKATGYLTVAELKPSPEEFPGVPEGSLVAGSAVFIPVAGDVADDPYGWWRLVAGASWKYPDGPGSDLKGKEEYPAVHLAWEDAAAYAKWAGKRLPTEAEWEYAARGGAAGRIYAWGNNFQPGGRWMANTYQGRFPQLDEGRDGFTGIAPVKRFPPNEFGLYDMAGNVWEWCSDWYRDDYYQTLSDAGLAVDPKGPADPYDPQEPGSKKKVQRGGSFLCTDQYCARYMVGSRGKGEYRSSTNHVGFRCVKDALP